MYFKQMGDCLLVIDDLMTLICSETYLFYYQCCSIAQNATRLPKAQVSSEYVSIGHLESRG